jgi:hypothetical protein
MWHHVGKSAEAILRSYVMFKPLGFFTLIGTIMLVAALVPFVRYLVLILFFREEAGQHLQSLILGVALLIGSLLAYALGVLADLQRTNRVLIEESLERLKTIQYGGPRTGSDE